MTHLPDCIFLVIVALLVPRQSREWILGSVSRAAGQLTWLVGMGLGLMFLLTMCGLPFYG